jgi:hypothetical protein
MSEFIHKPPAWKHMGSPSDRTASSVAAEINRRQLAKKATSQRELAELQSRRLERARQFKKGERLELPEGGIGIFVRVEVVSASARIRVGRNVVSYDPLVLGSRR